MNENKLNALIPELLAPAGSLECLETAILYGADAVYLGAKQFGMRASPQNFNPDELRDGVKLCHDKKVKVYLTCNTLPTNQEADELPDFIKYAAQVGVDALIVADIGALRLAKRLVPELDVHVSTQAGVVNYLTAGELFEMGASRVVLAREMSFEEIKVLRDKTPPKLMIEAFVHGAMCIAFSGRCALSQYLTGRDANRGECAQPCRWGYHLMEEKRDGQFFPIFEDEKGSYILNAQDLCMIQHIDKMAEAGITSLKIEGRAKSAYYVAAITGAYRQAIDIYAESPSSFVLPDWLAEETTKVSHRKYNTGFYFKDRPPAQYDQNGYLRRWDVVATVEGFEDGWVHCIEKNRFMVGESLEVLMPGEKPFEFCVERIIDQEGNELEVACHPMMKVKIPCQRRVPQGSMLRRRVETEAE